MKINVPLKGVVVGEVTEELEQVAKLVETWANMFPCCLLCGKFISYQEIGDGKIKLAFFPCNGRVELVEEFKNLKGSCLNKILGG